MHYLTFTKHAWAMKAIWMVPLAFLLPINLAVNFNPEYEKESKCAYVIILMAILWLTEAIPIPVTALIPIFLFPMLEVNTAEQISGSYVTDTTMLFLGGLIIAVALEESGLHVRISLCIMIIVGAQPLFLMAGLMTTTWFLSMWMSNTAATSMMVPIIRAVVESTENIRADAAFPVEEVNYGFEMEVTTNRDSRGNHPTTDNTRNGVLNQDSEHVTHNDNNSNSNTNKTVDIDQLTDTAGSHVELTRQAKAYALSVAYGANIGGIATLTGTPPNLVLKNFTDGLYKRYHRDSGITFATWMGFALPMSLLTALLGWLWLGLIFLRSTCFRKMDPELKQKINLTTRNRYEKLGRITFCEMEVLVVFVVLVFLLLFREPPNIKGWGDNYKNGYVSDSTPCILLSCMLFILPAKKPNVFGWLETGTVPSYTPILTWSTVVQKLSWSVIILLGGGFAIARASKDSGLSAWLGNELRAIGEMDMWIMNVIICVIVAAATEVSSNTATATLLMPILSDLAMATSINPTYLLMSAAISCSFAFMLPVATPPNAIVFATGYLTIPDMALAGLPMNIIAVTCLTLAINTWGVSMFGFDKFPDIFTMTTVSNVTQTI